MNEAPDQIPTTPQIAHLNHNSPLAPRPSPLRETLEFIAFWFIVALLFCAFVVQPFFVPTGSMAPVLLGLHKEVVCPHCGGAFPVGVDANGQADTDSATCPHCGDEPSLADLSVSGGDRVLVWKAVHQLRPIRRWEMVVFIHPQSPKECYVKRAVGFPGERIQIKHGDVYIEGELEAKRFEQLAAMAISVGRVRAFAKPTPTSLHVARSSDGRSIAIAGRTATGEPAALRDLLSYNAGGDTWERDPIRDVIAEMNVGERIEVHFHGLPGTPIKLLVEYGQVWLAVGGETVRGNSLPKGKGRRLTFAYWDGRIGVRWNGKSLIEDWVLPANVSDREPETTVPLLTLTQFDEPPTDFHLRRDVYYTERVGGARGAGVDEPFQLGPKEHFMLGDNSAVSRDSRAWDHPGVSSDLFVGKPIVVHWPLVGVHIPGVERTIQLPALSRIRLLK